MTACIWYHYNKYNYLTNTCKNLQVTLYHYMVCFHNLWYVDGTKESSIKETKKTFLCEYWIFICVPFFLLNFERQLFDISLSKLLTVLCKKLYQIWPFLLNWLYFSISANILFLHFSFSFLFAASGVRAKDLRVGLTLSWVSFLQVSLFHVF